MHIDGFNVESLSCISPFVGTATASVCPSHNTPYVVSGCQEDKCTKPAAVTGYDFASAGGSLLRGSFGPTGAKCGVGYTGTVTYSVCAQYAQPYGVAGCKPTCNTPAAKTGYEFGSAGGTLTIDGFNANGAVCDTNGGYTGTVKYTVCSGAAADYGVTGCEATCKVPKAVTGYKFAAAGGTLTQTNFAPSGAECDVTGGYTGTVAYTVCSGAGLEYGVTGCEATCRVPKAFTGYDLAAAKGTLTRANFKPDGAVCNVAGGYTGTVKYTVCQGAGEEYKVTGCEATCKVPAAVTGYDFGAAGGALQRPSFSPTGVVCDKTAGYTGTVAYAVCKGPGEEYEVKGCEATCKLPAPSVEYDFGGAWGILTIKDFKPDGVVCNVNGGYTGTVKYTACQGAGQEYVVEGCEETCTVPKKIQGYEFSLASGPLQKSNFKPEGVVCQVDGGYAGTIKYTFCKGPGKPYEVEGCEQVYFDTQYDYGGLSDMDVSCYMKADQGTTYRGLVSLSASGSNCAKWVDVEAASKFSDSEYYGNHNYCRNFKEAGYDTPWCYAVDTGKEELCVIPQCNPQERDFHDEAKKTVEIMHESGVDCGCADELYGSTRTTQDTAVPLHLGDR